MASITSTQGVSMDEKSSPTTSGPDSDVASVEEDLPNDNVSEEGNQRCRKRRKSFVFLLMWKTQTKGLVHLLTFLL